MPRERCHRTLWPASPRRPGSWTSLKRCVPDAADYTAWMRHALQAARPGGPDVPVGAVVVDRAGTVLAAAGNERELTGDPTAHAEVVALRRAAVALGSWRLAGCTLVV